MSLKNKLLAGVLLIFTSCAPITTRQTSNYKEVIARYNTMALLPVEVEINSVDAGGKTKRFYDYEYHLESLIKDNIIPEMKLKGFKISFLSRKDAHDKGIYNEVLQLRQKYNEEMKVLHGPKFKEKNASSIDVNFGQFATRIGEVENADLLMIVDFSGYARTSGAVALSFLTGMVTGIYSGGPSAGSSMLISIIDSKTGKLLWNNTALEADALFTSSSNNRAKQDKIDNKMISTLMKRIFKPFCYKCKELNVSKKN
jgi:hypothetical protein